MFTHKGGEVLIMTAEEIEHSLAELAENIIKNEGENLSSLSWKIVSHPSWGNWDFSRIEGNYLKEGHSMNVTVTIRVPKERNQNFTGEIKIINKDDPSQYCIIKVSMKTKILSFPSLLLQRFPFLRFLESLLNK